MEEKRNRVCWIRVAKNISYFIIPVLILCLILSFVSIIYEYEIGGVRQEEDYFQTRKFAEKYVNNIDSVLINIQRLEDEIIENSKNGYYNHKTDEVDGKKMEVFRQRYDANYIYIVINNNNNTVYVNGNYDLVYDMSIENLKKEILSEKYYWIYEDGKINTTIEKLNMEHIKNSIFNEEILEKEDYTIYTAIIDDLPYYDDYFNDYMIYKVVKNQYEHAIYNIPICIILLIIMIIIIVMGIGRTREKDGISLCWFDKLPIEISVLILMLIGFVLCGITLAIGTNIAAIVSIISITISMLFLYIILIFFFETIVKRIKTHTFMKTTFIYLSFKYINRIFENMRISVRVGSYFAGFVICNWIIFLISLEEQFLAFILLMILYFVSFFFILKRTVWQEKINNVIELIYKGNTNIKLDLQEYKGNYKKVAIQINDIIGGLSNAIEERLKSERLKTELITNVSHDIKTPLTSIINYVDLLKKEDISNEKAAEYLMILDNKSQRLKKLTEDLVEASKASSGNIKMNMEKLEVNELIKQVSAEFEDKFKKRGLEQIITFTEEKVYITADNRYMYRVLENMYSNISKYALDNSRVYTDIIKHNDNVIIQIKNISKEKLNITADELMQRFVRGDTSRNTEGSGLGLSIANSLTELQNGKFHIYLDGDLFKVTIGFQISKE